MGLAVAAGAALPAQTQTVELALRDGRVWLATALQGEPGRDLEAVVGGERRRIGAGELLAVHGVAVQTVELASAWLRGGEVLRGALVSGDATGDHLELLSPTLGRVVVAVDRLTAFGAPAASHLRPADLPLPDGVGEAILQRAAIGYDLVAGTLHQFGEQGVRFQPDGDRAPRWFRLQDFLALRIADAVARPAAAQALLLTRTGDRLGVVVRAFTGAGVRCELENGATVEVRAGDLACVSFAGVGTFLSDLQPKEVSESGFDGDAVHPWQRDTGALGGPLVAGERTHAKGLGVHSRSRLVFTVPAGTASFWTRVAVDDSAGSLAVRANVDVRVLVGGAVRFEHKGLEPGQGARDTGLMAVRPGETVTLEVDFGKGRDLGDRVDWLSPVFLPGPGAR